MTDKPNILVIMSDDQGPWAMGCAGSPDIRTPNLDRLAAAGIRFENFFCTSPVCSPARASFLTGRIPSDHGVHDWIAKGSIAVAKGVHWSGADQPVGYLDGIRGFTDYLADDGYLCGLSGKWHLGDSGRPQNGHTWWYAYALGGDHYADYLAFDNSPELLHKTEYVTDYYTDRALEFLQEYGHGEKPFCLSLHYTAPHAPWSRQEHPADIFESYDACCFETVPRVAPHPWNGWNPTEEQRLETLRGYATAITAMDQNIGRVLDHLDRTGLRDDTLVVFLSDNGFSMGHHGIMGKGNGTWPLNMYEEAVKVPFIASMPGTLPAGVVYGGMWSQYDWLPTVLEVAGVEAQIEGNLPGRSFAHVLRGESDEGRDRLVVFDEYGPTRMIRTPEWKYVQRFPDGPNELYNLVDDPGEDHNLAGAAESSRDIIGRLRSDMDTWFAEFSRASRDGAGLPVTGEGQLTMVDTGDRSVSAFCPRPSEGKR